MGWFSRKQSTLYVFKFWIGDVEREVERVGDVQIMAKNCEAIAVAHTALEAREKLISWAKSNGHDFRWLKVASVAQFDVKPGWIAWIEA